MMTFVDTLPIKDGIVSSMRGIQPTYKAKSGVILGQSPKKVRMGSSVGGFGLLIKPKMMSSMDSPLCNRICKREKTQLV